MTTLEDQIRRYAVDVAGPAVAEPPADLFTVGRPRHRGRWVLVAALAAFIAGLTWVATRPNDSSAPPVVDRPQPQTTAPTTIPVPPQVTSRVAERGTTCRAEGPFPGLDSTASVSFAGSDGAGLCAEFAVVPTPAYGFSYEGPPNPEYDRLATELLDSVPRVDVPQVWWYLDGEQMGGMSISACHAGWVQTHPLGSVNHGLALVTASSSTEFVRFDTDAGPVDAQAADLPGLDGIRVVMVRLDALADQPLAAPQMTALDADLRPLAPSTTTALAPGCNPLESALDSPALVDDGIGDNHPLPLGG